MANLKCAVFGKCGGCATQHIDYLQQLQSKTRRAAELLRVEKDRIEVFASEPYFYRSKIDFMVGKSGLGMRGVHSKFVPISVCIIASDLIGKLSSELQGYFDLHRSSDWGWDDIFCSVTFRGSSFGDAAVLFVLDEKSKFRDIAVRLIYDFSRNCSVSNVSYILKNSVCNDNEWDFGDSVVVSGSAFICESLCGKTFEHSIAGFFQNNPIVAEKMLSFSRSILSSYGEDTKKETLLDLYGGVGVFGIVNSDIFSRVIVVESVDLAIECANRNFIRNGVSNGSAYVLDSKQIGRLQLDKSTFCPLFVICDPPRVGMDEKVISELKRLKPEVILYVSCNLMQLAKDVIKFKDYKIGRIGLFDMFPQTNHVEVVVELRRKNLENSKN